MSRMNCVEDDIDVEVVRPVWAIAAPGAEHATGRNQRRCGGHSTQDLTTCRCHASLPVLDLASRSASRNRVADGWPWLPERRPLRRRVSEGQARAEAERPEHALRRIERRIHDQLGIGGDGELRRHLVAVEDLAVYCDGRNSFVGVAQPRPTPNRSASVFARLQAEAEGKVADRSPSRGTALRARTSSGCLRAGSLR